MKGLPPISQRYIQTLEKICGKVKEKILPVIFIDDESKKRVDEIIAKLNLPARHKLICIAPASKHFTKTYPSELYAKLINYFDADKYSFLLVGKGSDSVNAEAIKLATGTNVHNLCDQLNISELTELIKRSWLFISGDTGPMHIADSLNIPMIMLAGSSVREFGFYPQSEHAVVLEVDNLNCRPCSHIGRNECPKGHFRCMMEIKAEEILRKVNLT